MICNALATVELLLIEIGDEIGRVETGLFHQEYSFVTSLSGRNPRS